MLIKNQLKLRKPCLKKVEWEHAIVFDMFTETVTLNNSFDFMYINVICDRMKELNFID